MVEDKNILKVKIFGTEYPLKVNSDVEYVRRVAAYVDMKMREVETAKVNRPLHQIAILAALNIADELFQQQKLGKQKFSHFEENVEQLIKKLELGIKESVEDEDPKPGSES